MPSLRSDATRECQLAFDPLMDGIAPTSSDTLVAQVAALVPAMQARAGLLDRDGAFPSEDLKSIAYCGGFLAPFPVAAGGLGLGTSRAGADGMLQMLRLLGRGNLSVGRVFEAHVNAVRLLVRYGTEALVRSAASDAAAGRLFALWVTDPAQDGLRAIDGVLHGGKEFCSAAGYATRAVVTVDEGAEQPRLMLVDVASATVTPLPGGLLGMRAAVTGRVRFDGLRGTPFGTPGDYLREPDLSTGAWRTSAVTLGGLEALAAAARTQLVSRGRHADPHQQARMGHVLIAEETARLWMHAAATRAEDADSEAAVAYVNLARLAVERACLESMELIQRSLGLAAFLHPNPVERLCRDLATYLRQPAGDMVLTEAAAYAMTPHEP